MKWSRRPSRHPAWPVAGAWTLAIGVASTLAVAQPALEPDLFVGPAPTHAGIGNVVAVEPSTTEALSFQAVAPALAHEQGKGGETLPEAQAELMPTGAVAGGRESQPLGPASAEPPQGGRDSTPMLGDAASAVGPTMTTMAGVVALAVIIFGGIHLARRHTSMNSSRAPSGILEVLGRYPMAGGPTLILMRAGPRVLLLSQARASRLGGSTLATLAEFDDPDQVAGLLNLARDAREESISARFGTLLSAFSAEHRPGAGGVEVRESGGEEVEIEVVDRGEAARAGSGGHHAATRLRQRLEGLRAWEGATA